MCINSLTKREKELLNLMAKGKSRAEIAAELNISIHTVKAHLERMYLNFDVHNKSELIFKCLQAGLINI